MKNNFKILKYIKNIFKIPKLNIFNAKHNWVQYYKEAAITSKVS